MMDRYDINNDRYCYPNTDVLINKLNIQDMDTLVNAEREITSFTIARVKFSYPPYSLCYMRELHYQLFSELYSWAGEIRTVDIAKVGTRFCTHWRIERESEKLFNQLERANWLQGLNKRNSCIQLAEYYIEFNMIHPFREGNGRVQRLLFEHLALSMGYTIDWGKIGREAWIEANIDGVRVNYEPMIAIFEKILQPHFLNEKRILQQ